MFDCSESYKRSHGWCDGLNQTIISLQGQGEGSELPENRGEYDITIEGGEMARVGMSWPLALLSC